MEENQMKELQTGALEENKVQKSKAEEKMLTLEKFEEASETVKRVTQETKLVYSKYLSEQTGNKVYLKPEICSLQAPIS